MFKKDLIHIVARYILFCIPVILFSCYSGDKKEKRFYEVLVVHTYSPDRCSWVNDINRGVETCVEDQGLKVNMHLLSLNFLTGTGQEARDSLCRILKSYRDKALDLILVYDDEATLALMECKDSLAMSVPVVFSGVDYVERTELMKNRNFTGFMTTPDYITLHKLALQLFGDVRVRGILVDTSRVGLMAMDTDIRQMKNCPGVVRMDSLYRYVEPDGRIRIVVPEVKPFPIGPGQLRTVQYFIKNEELNMYLRYAFTYRPDYYFVMSHWNEYYSLLLRLVDLNYLNAQNEGFGENTLGGYFCSSYDQGYQAMERGIEILKGKMPESFLIEMSPKSYYFDWKVMQKWHIPIEKLPENCTIINMPFSERHKKSLITGAILGGLIIFMFGGGLVKGVYTEMKKKRKLYKELRDKERKLSVTISSINEGIVMLDNRHRMVKMNDTACRLFISRSDNADYIGKPIWQYCKIAIPNYPDYGKELLEETEKSGKIQKMSPLTCLILPEGISLPIAGTIAPVSGMGENLGFIFSFVNITDEMVNQKYIELGIAAGNAFMWRFSEDNRYLVADQNFYAATGMPETQKAPSLAEFMTYIHPDDVKIWVEAIENVENMSGRTIQLRLKYKDGCYKWMEFQVGYRYEMWNGAQQINPYGFCTEINDLKVKENQLREVLEEAEEADRQKTLFLHNMSHEIRTPLNAIVGFCGILSEGDGFSEEEKRDFADTVNKNCNALMAIINTILDISRVENGIPFQKEVFSVHEVMNKLMDISPSFPDKHIEVEVCMPENELVISGDQARLFQVLNHLLNNAVKFSSEGGKVMVRVEDKEKDVAFYVQDSGIGIDAKDIERIFDRFYRVNDFIQGTGLGLSLCNEIVKRMRGTICVESELGKGATFCVEIPKDFSEPEISE